MRHKSQRVAIVLSMMLHAMLVLALIWWWRAPADTRRLETGLTIFDISDMSAASAPRDPLPVEILRRPEKLSRSLASLPPTSGLDAGANAGCGIVSDIQHTLLEDTGAIEELAAVPPEERSVAGAIVLWSGDPIAERPPLPLAYAAIRRQLSAARTKCLDDALTGPDLLYLKAANGEIALAFGSGQWRWRDFLTVLEKNCETICDPVRISP